MSTHELNGFIQESKILNQKVTNDVTIEKLRKILLQNLISHKTQQE